MSVKVSLIAAVARNGVIGANQSIPWHIPSDFAWFKQTTMGKPMIMGRKQFETFPKPLPGRPEGVLVFNDADKAIEKAREIARADGVDEIMIIGGGDLYAQLMNRADRLYITHIDLAPAGDVRFPAIDPAIWTVVDVPDVPSNPKDEASYRVKVYERHKGSSH
jgi:dihydrofolate reductase